MRSYNPTYKPNLNQLRRTAEELAKARKPIILAGGGVIMANASEVLCELALELNIPVATTLMGLGAFPANGDLWLGMVGMHGTYAANMSINHAAPAGLCGRALRRPCDRPSAGLRLPCAHRFIDIDPTSIRRAWSGCPWWATAARPWKASWSLPRQDGRYRLVGHACRLAADRA